MRIFVQNNKEMAIKNGHENYGENKMVSCEIDLKDLTEKERELLLECRSRYDWKRAKSF